MIANTGLVIRGARCGWNLILFHQTQASSLDRTLDKRSHQSGQATTAATFSSTAQNSSTGSHISSTCHGYNQTDGVLEWRHRAFIVFLNKLVFKNAWSLMERGQLLCLRTGLRDSLGRLPSLRCRRPRPR